VGLVFIFLNILHANQSPFLSKICSTADVKDIATKDIVGNPDVGTINVIAVYNIQH